MSAEIFAGKIKATGSYKGNLWFYTAFVNGHKIYLSDCRLISSDPNLVVLSQCDYGSEGDVLYEGNRWANHFGSAVVTRKTFEAMQKDEFNVEPESLAYQIGGKGEPNIEYREDDDRTYIVKPDGSCELYVSPHDLLAQKITAEHLHERDRVLQEYCAEHDYDIRNVHHKSTRSPYGKWFCWDYLAPDQCTISVYLDIETDIIACIREWDGPWYKERR